MWWSATLHLPIASACRLSSNEVTLSNLNNGLSGLYNLLKHKERLSTKPGIQNIGPQLTGPRKPSDKWLSGMRMNDRKENWKLWGHTTSYRACCEVPDSKEPRGTAYCTWSFMPERENQCNCGKCGKSVYASWPEWWEPWAVGGGYSSSSVRCWRQETTSRIKTLWHTKSSMLFNWEGSMEKNGISN